ncbi:MULTISPECIES: hypothetical protein [Staphylococcaceae]|uniref:hypothetical protein n=1 Tax=Staphylococcaceae TaxID=90964 RepID=UPI00105EC7D2|nr:MULTISPECIES: hypothetical protein [Macrococcus]MBC9875662.1 hypothetical protein [Macrococcus bohemicus]TDM41522.1 hypothetical protein ETI10_00100 [Macrococcus goetzii]TDM48545.1 hypothetical protein ETI08_05205 [Macrococcus goetzii]UTH16700.1 hypothetical protein KFV12_02715 [Macrococcus epidermidis]
MKKQIVMGIVAGSLLLSNSAHAETRPSDLPRKIQSYEAVLKQSVYAFDKANYNVIKLYKGRKITIVERKVLDGYDYLIAKGNIYIPINNNTVAIKKKVAGKVNYNTYRMSKTLQSELKKLGPNHRDYANYKRDAISYEKEMKRSIDAFLPSLIAVKLHKQTTIPAGLEGPDTMTYKQWASSNYAPSPVRKVTCPVSKGNKLNLFSNSFINHFFGTNSYRLNTTAPGQSLNYERPVCKMTGTGFGYFLSNGNVGYSLTANYPMKVKQTAVIATYPYSYKTIIDKFGKPTSVKHVVNRVDETQVTYNADKHNGYKVIVGFDRYKGNLKYMIKVRD